MLDREMPSLDDCDAGEVACFSDYFRRTNDPRGERLWQQNCSREVAMIITAPHGRMVVFTSDGIPEVLDAQAVAIQGFMEFHRAR